MATVQAYTKSGVDAKFNSRSNMTLVHTGGGTPDIAAFPDAKTGDVIERSGDGARWSVIARNLNPAAGRVVSVAGKSGVVTLTPSDVGAAPASHTHTKAQITDLNASTSAVANSIAQRGTGGVLVVGTPTATTHATTKAYVDSRITGGITWGNLSGKPSTFPPSAHTHTVSQITNLNLSSLVEPDTIPIRNAVGLFSVGEAVHANHAASKGYVDSEVAASKAWSAITGKPTTYAPSTHSHTQAQVTGLPAKLTTYDTAVTKVNSAVSNISGSTANSGSLVSLSSSGRLTSVNPSGATDVANKQYVDNEISAKNTWANTSGKPSTFAPSPHNHTVADITDLTLSQTAAGSSVVQRDSSGRATVATPTATGHATTKAYVDNAVTAGKAWSAITGKPSTFPPSAHTHTMAQITDLPAIRSTIAGDAVVQRRTDGHVLVHMTPSDSQHATSKQYVDNAVTAGKAWSAITGKPSTFTPSEHTHTMSQITDLPVVATSVDNNSIVKRTSTGQVTVPSTPTDNQDATSKRYVDTKFESTNLTTLDLNDVTTPGNYYQSQTANATTERNYPAGAQAGHLVVLQGGSFVKQEYTDYESKFMFYRTKYNDSWYAWRSISQSTV